MMTPCVEVKSMNPLMGDKFNWPEYATFGSAGLDLRACLTQPIELLPGETKIVPSGIAVNIQDRSLMAMVAPRSGLGTQGLVLANLIGIIDSDYQGEIKLAMWNRTSDRTIVIEPGQRICQMIFVPVKQVEFKRVSDFSQETQRAAGGFGHSGNS